MTEFHIGLTEDEAKRLIEKKMEIYGKDFRYHQWPPVIQEHEGFVYKNYARYYKKDIGSFDLVRYAGCHKGIELYSFYVETPATEENRNSLEKRIIENARTLKEIRIKRKYENMKVKQLDRCMKEKNLPVKKYKNDKIKALIDYELENITSQ